MVEIHRKTFLDLWMDCFWSWLPNFHWIYMNMPIFSCFKRKEIVKIGDRIGSYMGSDKHQKLGDWQHQGSANFSGSGQKILCLFFPNSAFFSIIFISSQNKSHPQNLDFWYLILKKIIQQFRVSTLLVDLNNFIN